MSNRREQRKDFDAAARLSLLEVDMDHLEDMISQGAVALQKSVEDFRNEMKAARGMLIGILVSVTTAALLLAINLAVMR